MAWESFYHLPGQSGRFTVWANGTQNSRLVNFAPEVVRLPFVKLSSISQITATKAWNWNQRWLEEKTSVWNIPSGKIGLPFQMFRIIRRLYVNGKQPVFPSFVFAYVFEMHLQRGPWRTAPYKQAREDESSQWFIILSPNSISNIKHEMCWDCTLLSTLWCSELRPPNLVNVTDMGESQQLFN